jgi:hypothetical protein
VEDKPLLHVGGLLTLNSGNYSVFRLLMVSTCVAAAFNGGPVGRVAMR